ncbi:hypothetical protein ABIE65_002021 [Constrictibacter sp. MBR-5]|jgi:hypothetical protein|uniref:hypothetical protein n=1 Tax=Constrictibacter sp. MBR-5 TaxID=3156467 RepID=UPI0033986E80
MDNKEKAEHLAHLKKKRTTRKGLRNKYQDPNEVLRKNLNKAKSIALQFWKDNISEALAYIDVENQIPPRPGPDATPTQVMQYNKMLQSMAITKRQYALNIRQLSKILCADFQKDDRGIISGKENIKAAMKLQQEGMSIIEEARAKLRKKDNG